MRSEYGLVGLAGGWGLALMLWMGVLLLAGSGPSVTAAAGSCGLKPLKPLVPLGCDDLRAECVCDEKGKNCKWQWICVKK